ncbi:hypothetical protein GCM10022254_66690 [Actinomadura meridiana]|uniref:Uncharacterized protein n=1 Tax=Actinomadura meridiana TaxID=559626 RepID=A0ABP8CMV9_9ACTN
MTDSPRRPGVVILLAVAAVVGCVLVVGVAAVVYTLMAWEPSPAGEGGVGPRAARGSDPRITFEQAARDLSLALPGTVSRLRYAARHDSRPYILEFSFVMPCSSIAEFRDGNDLVQVGESLRGSSPPAEFREMAATLGGPLPEGPATVLTDEDDHDSINRRAVVVSLSGRDCRVVGDFTEYT